MAKKQQKQMEAVRKVLRKLDADRERKSNECVDKTLYRRMRK